MFFYVSHTSLLFTASCTDCCYLKVEKVTNESQESLSSKEFYQEYGVKLEK